MILNWICILWYIFHFFLGVCYVQISIFQFKFKTFSVSWYLFESGFAAAEFLGQDCRLSLICYQSFATSAFWILWIFFSFFKSISLHHCHLFQIFGGIPPPSVTHISANSDIWGLAKFFQNNFDKIDLAHAGLIFYLKLIRWEHFDIWPLTSVISFCLLFQGRWNPVLKNWNPAGFSVLPG